MCCSWLLKDWRKPFRRFSCDRATVDKSLAFYVCSFSGWSTKDVACSTGEVSRQVLKENMMCKKLPLLFHTAVPPLVTVVVVVVVFFNLSVYKQRLLLYEKNFVLLTEVYDFKSQHFFICRKLITSPRRVPEEWKRNIYWDKKVGQGFLFFFFQTAGCYIFVCLVSFHSLKPVTRRVDGLSPRCDLGDC